MDEFNPVEFASKDLTLLFGIETVRKWRRIVSRSPRDVNPRLILASLLTLEKRYKEAVTEYEQTLQILQNSAQTQQITDEQQSYFYALNRYELGNVLWKSGRREEAKREWEMVMTLASPVYTELARRKLITHVRNERN